MLTVSVTKQITGYPEKMWGDRIEEPSMQDIWMFMPP